MKRVFLILFVLVFCATFSASYAERRTVEKDRYYIGAMRVVRCREYVSLREVPDKTAARLAKVPLDAIVLYCSNNVRKYDRADYRKQAELFIRCEYEGQVGYILKKYLIPAPEFEPAETRTSDTMMQREEIVGNGSVVLDWHEFNVSVLAAYEVITEEEKVWETIRVGCFIDDDPIWGYTEDVVQKDETPSLNAFMGGTEDEPQVYVYDSQYGLILLDLMDGIESWELTKVACPLGDASVRAVSTETGVLYVAGSEGPDPVAISAEGAVLWRAEIDDPEVFGPKEIKLQPNEIEVVYESGHTVSLEYSGEVISVSDT